MAKAVGTSRQSIESLEAAGNRQPRYLKKLATVMGLTTDALINGAYVKPTPATHLPQLALNSHNEAQKQPQVLMQTAPSAIKNIANEAANDNSDLVAALRAFGLRLEHADDTTRRRVKAVLNDLVDDPASHESLLPMLNAALTTPAPSKRRAA